MSYPINASTYPKSKTYPVGHGYSTRPGDPISVVVHSTEGVVGQSLSSAANYIYTSSAISAHYLIGRQAEIIQFLDPQKYSAWHSGDALSTYVNVNSIGIECLHARGENWPQAQKDCLAWLLQELCKSYAIPSTQVDTHGQVALPGPYVRKVDPTDWPHPDFIAWRDSVLRPPAKPYRVMGLPVYERADHTGLLWGYLAPGQSVKIDDPNNGHVCEVDGVTAGIGFVDLSGLTPL